MEEKAAGVAAAVLLTGHRAQHGRREVTPHPDCANNPQRKTARKLTLMRSVRSTNRRPFIPRDAT